MSSESGFFEDRDRPDDMNGIERTMPRGLQVQPTAISKDLAKNARGFKDKYVSVFKVFVHKTEPNFSSPWQMKSQRQSIGTAFAIEGQRLLTNAHVVSYASQVLVRRHGEAKRYIAKIISVAHDSDLALLSVPDPEFWNKGIEPLELEDEAPHLQDAVTVIGYPSGGENLSITAGVVSRVDVWNYAHSGRRMLCIQIDAAINSGNSGGPIVNYNGEAVGIVTSKMVGLGIEGLGFGISMPSALESLGVEIKSQHLMPNSTLTACGNLIL